MPGMRREQWTRVIDVSLNGFFNVTQPLLMPMIAHALGPDRQHLLGRRDRRQPRADQLRGRQGGAARRHRVARAGAGSRGITVNAVAPGIIASPMAEAPLTPRRSSGMVPDEARRDDRRRSPTSSASSHRTGAYISGQVISINGAMI